jgi:hypothetical protein
LGAPNLSNDIVAANGNISCNNHLYSKYLFQTFLELVFPPYIRSAMVNGIRELIDLERILFDKPVG